MRRILLFLIWGLSFLLSLFPLNQINAQRINDLTGINAHANTDPLPAQKKFTWVREWHDWSSDVGFNAWNDQSTHCFSLTEPSTWPINWNPTHNQTGTQIFFDDYYNQLSHSGNVIPVLKGIAPQFRGYTNYNGFCGYGQLEAKPFCPTSGYGASDNCYTPAFNNSTKEYYNLPSSLAQAEEPTVFQEHALWLSLFAAKFGWSQYSVNQVQPYIATTNEININQGYIAYLEDNNETNKTWWEKDGQGPAELENGQTYWYFSPKQYANMFSADYDGHLNSIEAGNGTIGMFNVGVNNAAEGVTLVPAGTTGLNGRYYKDIKEHWDSHRSGDIPPIIANFHHYSTDLSSLQNSSGAFEAGEYSKYTDILIDNDPTNGTSVGVTPEADKLREKLQWLKAQLEVDGVMPEEYWVSEIGYDSFKGFNESGVEVDQSLNGGDVEKTHAQWLTRTVLEASWSKVLNKMMLYNLRDDENQGLSSYAKSGLLTETGAKKKAWYHVMTLKEVLGEHHYVEEIRDGSGGFEVEVPGNPNADYRVYAYDKGDIDGTRIYAIWSPTASDVNGYMNLTFPPSFDIDFAKLTYIQDFSETGWTIDHSVAISGNTVNVIPFSETPIFLRVNGVEPEPDPTIMPLTDLSCQPMGCNSVKLTWQQSTLGTKINQITRTVRIFYKEMNNCNSGCEPFDYTNVVAYPHQPGVNQKSMIVTNLQAGKSYCFYVIPVGLNGNVAWDPDNPDNVASTCCSISNQQSNCVTPINPSDIVTTGWFPNDISVINTVLGNPGGSPGTPNCDDLNSAVDCNNAANQGWQGGTPNTFTINFSTPKLINAVYLQDWVGIGALKIEYQRCDCPNVWWDLTTIQLQGGGICDANDIPLLQSYPLSVHATAIRVTRLNPNSSIRRLFFCGEDLECPQSRPIEMGDPQDFQADQIRKHSALLEWKAAEWDTALEEPIFMENYILRISENILENGDLAEPITEIEVKAEAGEMEAMYRLKGLLPATTYYAELSVPTDGFPCDLSRSPVPQQLQFTTEAETAQRSHWTAPKPKPIKNNFTVDVFPNPSSDRATFVLSEGEIDRLVLLDISGKLLFDKKVKSEGAAFIDFSQRENGLYWVKVLRTDGSVKTVKLIKGGLK